MNLKQIFFLCFLINICSCNSNIKLEKTTKNKLIGTWELIASKYIQEDSVTVNDPKNEKTIKIINDTHFAFLTHDLNEKNLPDSVKVFIAGGGAYTLNGNQYKESLEYCNFRGWEGNEFDFTVEIRSDTLIQSGIEVVKDLGINRTIVETYKRVSH